MKPTRNLIIGSIALASLTGTSLYGQTFASASVLAEGNWTKIAINKTGLYEISYDQLIEMGFNDPSKVRIYGQGGRMCSEDLSNSPGNPVFEDDLRSVPVSHSEDKLYFYGLGTDNIKFSPIDGYFQNYGLNIFSDYGYYFLTDSLEGTTVTEASAPDSGDELSYGLWYTYHEEDLQQGNHKNGQLFWGEDFSDKGVGRLEWDAQLRDPLLNKSGTLAVEFYKDATAEITLQYGITAGTGGINKKLNASPNQTYFEPAKPRYTSVTPQSKENKVYIQVPDERPSGNIRLDYWVLSYKRTAPTLEGGIAQDAILFEGVGTGNNGCFNVENPESRRIFQITDPYNIIEHTPGNAEGKVCFTALGNDPAFLIFDPSKQQLQIEGYQHIANQNLHSWKQIGADLVIITTPEMKELAEKHADVHRRLQNMEVAVIDCGQLYNEFSSGHPDPMAYRAYIAMLYNNGEHKVKNVLLYGPATADIRSNVAQGTGDSRIILQQNRKNKIAFDHGASTVYDYYGIMSPTISNNSYETLKVPVGVGYLTVKNENDARIAREKVERYLSDDSHAHYINRMIAVACMGDNHTHEQQAIQTAESYSLSNYEASINSFVMQDDNTDQNGTEAFLSALDEGANVLQYLGHASLNSFGNPPILAAGQVSQLKNNHLPVMILAGCDLTLPELQIRGIAERIVLDTPHGAIACISTNRQAWSGPNFEFSSDILAKWGFANDTENNRLDEPRTIGELYAIGKTDVKNANELAFLLIGDPAIPVVSANRKVEFIAKTEGENILVAGHKAMIQGQVNSHSGELDNDFNGQIVLRLMEPVIETETRDFGTNCGSSVPFAYNNLQAAEIVAEVKNGKFSLTLPIPEYMNRFNGKDVRIVAGVYDADRRIGGVGSETMIMNNYQVAGMGQPAIDTQAPLIGSFEYDATTNTLTAYVSDDTALSTRTSPFYKSPNLLFIDDKQVETGRHPQISNSPDGTSAEMEFTLPELGYGEHKAFLTVQDQAGNQASAECRFVINPDWAAIRLSTVEGIADDKITFTVEGAVDNNVVLHILDNNGQEIFFKEATGSEIVWNCQDLNGNRVAPGLYKAFVRENSRNGFRAHSETIQVPVI